MLQIEVGIIENDRENEIFIFSQQKKKDEKMIKFKF